LHPQRYVYPQFAVPDFGEIHRELRRKGVTLQLLWEEYRGQAQGIPYSRSRFCERYIEFRQLLRRSMRQIHVAGEKLFVDYAGPTVPLIDPASGEITRAHIFVAVWGASNYTYAEATAAESKADWIAAHVNALTFFGGAPALPVPDNPRALIRDPDRYEPIANRTYEALAEHYGCAILPARPRKPQDKAKVEAGVLLVERWILARLRHWRFHSLAELNTNGMDPSSPERHQRARLEALSTSQRREGVHHEAYARWRRFGKGGLPGTRGRPERAGDVASEVDASELAQGIAGSG
jgi:transposase